MADSSSQEEYEDPDENTATNRHRRYMDIEHQLDQRLENQWITGQLSETFATETQTFPQIPSDIVNPVTTNVAHPSQTFTDSTQTFPNPSNDSGDNLSDLVALLTPENMSVVSDHHVPSERLDLTCDLDTSDDNALTECT